jgi:hypothetical protein
MQRPAHNSRGPILSSSSGVVTNGSAPAADRPSGSRDPGDVDLLYVHVDRDVFATWPSEDQAKARELLGDGPIDAASLATHPDPRVRELYRGVRTDVVDPQGVQRAVVDGVWRNVHVYDASARVLAQGEPGAPKSSHILQFPRGMDFREFYQHDRAGQDAEHKGALVGTVRVDLTSLPP